MQRRAILQEIDQLSDGCCAGCFLRAHLRKEKGRAAAHAFCIGTCTVGLKLQALGAELGERAPRRQKK